MPPDSGGRDAILDTSAKLFSQHGYKEVSIRDIAQACGMTNAALYYHFKNKEDLFLAMLERDHEKTLVALREAANGPGDLREDLKQLVAQYAAITCERPPVVSDVVARSEAMSKMCAATNCSARCSSELHASAGTSAWRRPRPPARSSPARRGSTRACCTA